MRMGGVAVTAVIAALAGGSLRPKKAGASKVIAKLADVKIGEAKEFTALDGSPAMLFRTKAGVFAYSRICTQSYRITHHYCNTPTQAKQTCA